MVKKEKSDVIVIDMKLPTIDGLETFPAVRRIDPEAKAVMITAYRQEMEERLEAAVKMDAYACISKLFDVDVLVGLIEEIAQKKAREQ